MLIGVRARSPQGGNKICCTCRAQCCCRVMHCPHLDYAKPASLLGSSCTNQFNQSSISFADWIPRRQNGWCRLQQLAQLQRRFWLHVTRVRAQPPPGSTCQHGGDLVLHVASACMCMHACTRPRPYVQMQSTSTTKRTHVHAACVRMDCGIC